MLKRAPAKSPDETQANITLGKGGVLVVCGAIVGHEQILLIAGAERAAGIPIGRRIGAASTRSNGNASSGRVHQQTGVITAERRPFKSDGKIGVVTVELK